MVLSFVAKVDALQFTRTTPQVVGHSVLQRHVRRLAGNSVYATKQGLQVIHRRRFCPPASLRFGDQASTWAGPSA